MLFNSLPFILFLPTVVFLYYLIPFRYRYLLLLFASYFFYASWNVYYLALIIFTTLLDYGLGLAIAHEKNALKRKLYLYSGLLANLGLLFFFKYFYFFTDTLEMLGKPLNWFALTPELKVLLPVGISFYTFQALSYLLEVYWGKQTADRHLGYFALYIVYFPQLVAGPIERYSRLTPQFRMNHLLNKENLRQGLQLVLFGLFVKMVIADNLAPIVDKVFQAPEEFNAFSVWIGVFFYSFQIYADFYGYSTVAVGSSLMMGIRIMDNFKTPYLSENIAEFWKRWHISLSTWFRDYLYIPLGGSRVKFNRLLFNILIVFAVSGLWHGANWTFVIWGLIHAILYAIQLGFRSVKPDNSKKEGVIQWRYLSVFGTFMGVTLAWVFFRSASFSHAVIVFQSMLNFEPGLAQIMVESMVWILLLIFVLSDFFLFNSRFDYKLNKLPFLPRWLIYGFLIYSILAMSGVEHVPFIYFQF